MKDLYRTLTFVGVALVSVVLAWFVHADAQPEEAEVYAKVGTEFYADFDDPTKARSMEIINYDENTKETQRFKVEFSDGQWRIPSHHGYPADAQERLEKAAASLIGITRQAVAGKRENAHERFGVIAPPETDELTDEPLEGIGQRVILKDRDGNLLADYILGKRVAGGDNLYFVRTPEEKETYHAEIDIDVSTKFADWIEKDLLKLDRGDLLSVEYSDIKELRQVVSPTGRPLVLPVKDTAVFHRKETGPGAEWIVDDVMEGTEEINTSGISAVQTALDALELGGVRPKLQGLTPNLEIDDSKFPKNQNANDYFRHLQSELSSRGFLLAPPLDEEEADRLSMFGRGGELIAKSNEGLIYHMHFGTAFNGTLEEIEVGKTKVADEKGNEVTGEDSTKTSSNDKTTLNRYLFIRVEFDESLLGKKPMEPVEPKKPEELSEQPAEEKSGAETKEKTDEEKKVADIRREYESQLTLYKNEKAIYDEDIKEFEERLEAGKSKVDELNARFKDWYYVIPETSYDNLSFTRADIVKEKEQEKPMSDPGGTGAGKSPLDDFINGKSQPAVAEKPTPTAEDEKPE